MRHPNIVQFMGLCQNAQGIYIVTEFVPGGHLWVRLKHSGVPLDWNTRVQWAIDISQAMSYLHRKNFLHRDLKSKNLLVGDNNHIKICDFGFARTTQDQRSEMYMTKTGTGLWMAPEVTLGRPYSAKADVFSFGVILRELITRTKPPPRVPRDRFGFNPHEFRKGVPADCPPAFLQMAVDCVSYEPEHRPDFKTALAKLKLLKAELPPPVVSAVPAHASSLLTADTPPGTPPMRVTRAEHISQTASVAPALIDEPTLCQKMQVGVECVALGAQLLSV
jgi:LIM domain kinase 1